MNNISTIFWDFDGVLMDSMITRDRGFVEVLKEYPSHEVEELMAFHRKNGGLSRYVKFRYFFETIRKEQISEEGVKVWASKFSKIMKELLCDQGLLIEVTNTFVAQNKDKYKMHIVSGSDGEELRYLCGELGIDQYFDSIHGSPTPKIQLVHDLMKEHNYDEKACVLIGDSTNDYDAAEENNIGFIGFNNIEVEKLTNCKQILF